LVASISPTAAPWRLLFTIPNFVTAGSGQAMVNVIERLDRRYFEPSVAIAKAGGPLIGYLESIDVPVVEATTTVPAMPYRTLPRRARRAATPLQAGQYDLWHSFHYADDYTEPIIARLAGARSWVFTKKNMSWGSRAWSLRALQASRIAVQNTSMLEEFFDGALLRGRCRYVPRGIDVDRWSDAPATLGLRASLGLHATTPVAACVGHIQPRKNQLAVVDALESVPDLHVLFAGRELDAGYASLLRQTAAEIGVDHRVHLLGPVDDVAALLAECDLFVLASRAEGSPVAVLEAMAAGLPGVYSAIPGITEAVRQGHDGLLVDLDDASGLAAALTMLVDEPETRRRLGKQAEHTAREKASIDLEVARHQSLYFELLAGRAPASA